MRAGKRAAAIMIVVIVGVIGLFITLNHFYVDYLWFREMGYLTVFFKELVTKLKLGIPVFLVLCVLMFVYFKFLHRISEHYLGVRKQTGSRLEKTVGMVVKILAALVIATVITDSLWDEMLKFIHHQDFGTADPLFGRDIGFYFFDLPFFKSAYHVIMLCFLVMAVMTLLYTAYVIFREQDFRVQTPENLIDMDVKSAFRTFLHLASRQIGSFLAVFFILLAAGLFIDRYEMVYGGTGMVYGAGATDIDVGLKLLYVKIGLCLVAAVGSIMAGFMKKYKLLIAGPVLLILVTLVGGISQGVYEKLVVVPNQFSKEEAYIQMNIDSTRQAYNLDDVEVKEFTPEQNITAEDIKDNDATISNIPINDQQPTNDMYNSLQGIRNYYQFYDVDVDRYRIDGKYTQTFSGTREMNNEALSDDARTWVNQHLKYTHGFGLAMSPVNKTNAVGQPELIVKDIPPQTETKSLEIDEPRVYFGEGDYDYVITNAKTPEFDYPEGDNNQENWYTGTAGIRLGFLNRVAFALYYGSPEMLLSSEITPDSRILINRSIMDRVQKIAPFLEYDNDPYMVISEGKQYWIIEGFTTSSCYPYAQPYSDQSANNYIKNSVKIVVDAYNGDVTFYMAEDEPVIATYSSIYPDMFKPISDMPSDLRSHLRYSKTLFDVQSKIYATYHMTNTQVFYNREDEWETASQFFGASKEEVPIDSAYTIMKLPGRDTEFLITNTFTPRNKDNMIAWLAGVSDGEDYGKLLVYQFPKQELVYGPMQIEQRIDQNTAISPQLTLLGQQGSTVLRGNMMTIPIENAILYVEAIYIQASGGTNNLPEVKKVIVSYQNDIVMADTLDAALGEIFDYDASQQETASSQTAQPQETTSDTAGLVQKANDAFNAAKEAQQSGDWAGYGKQLDSLEAILNQLKQAEGIA